MSATPLPTISRVARVEPASVGFMTATCTDESEAAVNAALNHLRDVTHRLYESQATMRSIAVERKQIVQDLRRRGVTLRLIGAAMGTTPDAAWLLTKNAGEEVTR